MSYVYILRFARNNAEPTETIVSAEMIAHYKGNVEHSFGNIIGRLFGWNGYAPEPSDEDDAAIDRRNMRGVATALIALADNRIDARISCKDAWASLVRTEVM